MTYLTTSLTNDVITYGTISLENVVRLPTLPTPEQPTYVTADYYRLGGEALNIALPLSVWGFRVGVVGNTLGEDAYADYILNELGRFPGVDMRFLERNQRARTPFSRILVTANEERHLLGYWFDEVPKRSLRPEMLYGARVLSTDVYGKGERIEAARVAKRAGLMVVASDVVWAEHDLLPLCDWVVISRRFLRLKFPDAEPEGHLRLLRHSHGGDITLVLTDGPNASRVLTPAGEWLAVPPYPLAPRDRIGAGDIFKAGLIYAILAEMPLIETIRFASAAAALWVAQPSAAKRPPTLGEIATLQAERGIHPRPDFLPYGEHTTICPLCRQPVSTPLFEKHWEMDRRLVRRFREGHPAWQRVHGACPSCIHEAVQQIRAIRAPSVLPHAIAEHPIYGQEEPAALPLRIRLQANPHYRGRGIRIAFLDSGFYPHPDLIEPTNRIVEFVDATTNEITVGADFSVPAPTSWHGLMTSAAAAGNGYLSDGFYAGLASEAEVLLIKVSNPQMGIHEVDILRGLRWLAKHWRAYNIQILNMSVGGDPGLRPDSELNQLVNQLVDEGLVVICAAGNTGRNDLCPPASALSAITVGGLDDRNTLDQSKHRIWHSNWGHVTGGKLKPELIAPSIWLAAPVLPGTSTAEQNLILDSLYRAKDRELPTLLAARLHDLDLSPELLNKPLDAIRMTIFQKLMVNKVLSPFYQHVDGTSFAAPIVSSIVAQMLEANPSLSPARLKELLIATARPLPNVPTYRQGYGVIMPGRAVSAALRERHKPYQAHVLLPQLDRDQIRFIFHEPNAKQVSIVGEWNQWNPTSLVMLEREAGLWAAEIPRLPSGHYEYKFLIDGHKWLDDPENMRKAMDGYGGFNSVLVV